MILDTSALEAILLRQPEAERFAASIETPAAVWIAAGSYLKAAISLDRNRNAVQCAMLDSLHDQFPVRIEAVIAGPAKLAR